MSHRAADRRQRQVINRRGDTLSGTAHPNGVGLRALEAANPAIGDPSTIHTGQRIISPAC